MSEILNVKVMGKTYPVTVEQDDTPESPRNWSNLGVMCCSHRRYTLGDKQLPSNGYCIDPSDALALWAYDEFIADRIEYDDPYQNEYGEGLNRAGLNRAWKWVERNLIVLPLFLYDHSGLALSTSPFSCSWDSGQLGFIVCSKVMARQELGVKRLTAQHIEQIKRYLRNEVDVYADYLNGSVYSYYNDEFGVGCGGFYGDDHDKSGLLESAISDITGTLLQKMKSHHHKLKAQIVSKVPLQYRQPLPI